MCCFNLGNDIYQSNIISYAKFCVSLYLLHNVYSLDLKNGKSAPIVRIFIFTSTTTPSTKDCIMDISNKKN